MGSPGGVRVRSIPGKVRVRPPCHTPAMDVQAWKVGFTVARALSKSRFQLGLQCGRLLWLKCNRPELADALTEVQEHIFASGTRVGELARERFGGGVLVDEDFMHPAEALATTARLMEDPPPAIFEAAFSHEDVFVRPDAIVGNADGSWDLYEVKSSTKLKEEHVTDVAVQLWVLEGAGLTVRSAFLMHLDNTYVHDGGVYDLERLFAAEDVTGAARAFMPAVPGLVRDMLATIAGPEPATRIGKHCDHPYTCAFRGHCHADHPRAAGHGASALERRAARGPARRRHPGHRRRAAALPGTERAPAEVWRARSLRAVPDRPRGGASPRRARVARALPRLRDHAVGLAALRGTRPWQQVPFQWSDHVLHPDGTVVHHEFLHTGHGDSRPDFAASLLRCWDGRGASWCTRPSRARACASSVRRCRILQSRSRASAAGCSTSRRWCAATSTTLRAWGDTSIKVVLPALVDTLSYEDLGIREGGTASLRYLRWLRGELVGDEAERLFADLRAYCATDTLAMLERSTVCCARCRDRRPRSGQAAGAVYSR